MVGTLVMARKLLDRALKLHPNLAASSYNRSLLYAKPGDLPSAQAAPERSAVRASDNDKVQTDLTSPMHRILTKRHGR